MPQMQEQLRVPRKSLDVTAFFISKHFISGERRLLRFQMSHPGQCGWPQILTIALLEASAQSDPAKIFTLSSHRRPCLLLKKQLRTELNFFVLFIKNCTLSVIPNPLKIPNLWIWRATSCLTMNLVELTFPLLAVLFDYWLVLLLSYHFLVRLT